MKTETEMPDKLDGSAAAEWRENWPVVLSSVFGIGLLTVYVYTTGIMIKPLEEEFGWTRAQISSGPTIVAVIGCIAAPFMGAAIDRFGARRIAIPGVICLCATIALLSQSGPSIWSWWALWFLVALAHPFIKPTVWVAAVSSVFSAGRGFALAVALCGTSVGSMVTPILTNYLIDGFGWRLAYVFTGAIWLAVVLPLVLFGFYGANDKRRVLARKQQAAKAAAPAALTGLAAREALLSAKFAMIATAAAVISMCSVAMTVNLVPIFSEDGIDRATAAWIAGVTGISGRAGKLVGGWLIDRFHAGRIVGTMTAMPALSALLMILFPGDIGIAVGAVALLGFALGVEFDGVAYLTSRHFGMRNFGLIYGTIAGLVALTSGIGPVVANHAYDVTGSYLPLLWSVVPLALVSGLLFLVLGPYPDRFEEPAPD
jgi:predicted MFS family arabinose efflux permease